jgi:hypothetical protein
MRKHYNRLGTFIAFIASALGFLLALQQVFSMDSELMGPTDAWLLGIFSLSSVIFSFAMFFTKTVSAMVVNILCILVAGFIAMICGIYWILIAMIVSLIGCIIYRASRPN